MNHSASEAFELHYLENKLLFAAADAARIGLCVIDEAGVVVTLTAGFARNIGTPGPELLGRSARRIMGIPGLSIARYDELIDIGAKPVATKATFIVGEKVSVLLIYATTFAEPGLGRLRVLTLVDVMDFGIDKDKLAQTRREIDALRSAVVLVDTRDPEYPIICVNHRFEEMTGYLAAEVVGRNCRFLQGELSDQRGLAEIRDAIKHNRAHHVILKNFRKNGEPFYNELFISPIFDSAGNATHYLGLQREMTDRA